MVIAGEKYTVVNVFNTFSTVPDCIVVGSNKIGKGHGEAKFYIASKSVMHSFYGPEGFSAKCIMLKKDLLNYMDAIKAEYYNPSSPYGINQTRQNSIPMSERWIERLRLITDLPEVIEFTIHDQNQIAGIRGYINSTDKGYQIIREIALPNSSFISAYQLKNKYGEIVYYWKLFVDFEAIRERKSEPLVFTYGKKKDSYNGNETVNLGDGKNKTSKMTEKIRDARNGQGDYRKKLLDECPFCPITKINDDRLLIASHIKPWVASNDEEKVDPKNGYILSPLFDKLFDRGFITFTEDRRVHLSNIISPANYERIGIKENEFFQALPMDDDRIRYLDFHHTSVFNGILDK